MRFSAVPLGHKFLAVLIAVGAAYGLHTVLGRRAVQTTSAAELSFDSDAARKIDPGLLTGAEPAAALAQSMLTDDVVAEWLSRFK